MAGVAEVGAHVAAWDLPERRNHGPETPIGTILEQGAVPLLVQIDTSVRVTPDAGEEPIDVAQLCKTAGRNVAAQLQGQALEPRQYGTRLEHLGGVQGRHAEAATHVRCENAFADQAQQRFPYRCAADAQLAGKLGVLQPRPGDEVAARDELQDLTMDFVPERCTSDDASTPG